MDGLTIVEIAEKLGISPEAAKKRLQKKGIKPTSKAGPTGIYPRSAISAIKDAKPVGWPKGKPRTESKE